jgi:hypothetical protein
MRTDDLLDALALDATPKPRAEIKMLLALSVIGGLLVAMIGVVLTFGLRPDFWEAVVQPPFWIKAGMTCATLLIALAITSTLARPEGKPGHGMWLIVVPFLVVGALALFEIGFASPDKRMALWLGSTGHPYPLAISSYSVPVFAVLILAMRQFAPTRLRLAGFAVGLAAGAVGAGAYVLHCQEDSMSFVATWYALAMLIPAVVGALLGPRLLRW